MSEATTPATEVAPQGQTNPSTPEGAISHISSLLDRMDSPAPAEVKDTKAKSEAAEITPSDEGESDAETEAARETDAETTEPETPTEPEAKPSTWKDVAAKLGADPAELAADVVIETKDGERVSVAELIRGHLRESDYTRKTSQLAEERKSAEHLHQQASAVWTQKLQEAGALVQYLESQMQGPSQQELDRLLELDPAEYVRTADKQKRTREALDQAKAALRQASERTQYESQQKQQAYRVEQQNLLKQKVEEYRDTKKAIEFEQGMFKYLGDVGYNAQEIEQFSKSPFDHRDILVIRDAAKWRQFQAGKDKVTTAIKDKPPVTMKPGPAKGKPSEQETIDSSRTRIRNARSDLTRRDAAIRYIAKIV